MSRIGAVRLAVLSVSCVLALSGAAGTSIAQSAPEDVVASPDVYGLRGENSELRVVEGTWKPRQRDRFHSHPAMGYYWVTDCTMRIHLPDGGSRDLAVMAGMAGVEAPIAAHSVENLGTSQCKIVMFEAK